MSKLTCQECCSSSRASFQLQGLSSRFWFLTKRFVHSKNCYCDSLTITKYHFTINLTDLCQIHSQQTSSAVYQPSSGPPLIINLKMNHKNKCLYLGVFEIEGKGQMQEGTDGCDQVEVAKNLLALCPQLENKHPPEERQ